MRTLGIEDFLIFTGLGIAGFGIWRLYEWWALVFYGLMIFIVGYLPSVTQLLRRNGTDKQSV